MITELRALIIVHLEEGEGGLHDGDGPLGNVVGDVGEPGDCEGQQLVDQLPPRGRDSGEAALQQADPRRQVSHPSTWHTGHVTRAHSRYTRGLGLSISTCLEIMCTCEPSAAALSLHVRKLGIF